MRVALYFLFSLNKCSTVVNEYFSDAKKVKQNKVNGKIK